MGVSLMAYAAFMGLTALERLVEVRVSLRNAACPLPVGKEHGRGHYPFMVVLHTGFLFACVAEVWLFDPFLPTIGIPPRRSPRASGSAVVVHHDLGPRWPPASSSSQACRASRAVPIGGSHPNYVVVVAEGLVLPSSTCMAHRSGLHGPERCCCTSESESRTPLWRRWNATVPRRGHDPGADPCRHRGHCP